MSEHLWDIPNTVEPGDRGDDTRDGWGSIEFSTELARAAEEHGWGGALLGAGWGRPDPFRVATALAARQYDTWLKAYNLQKEAVEKSEINPPGLPLDNA